MQWKTTETNSVGILRVYGCIDTAEGVPMRLTTTQDQRSATQKGTIKWFSHEKGYGFIDGNDGVRRFFHVADTVGDFSPKTGNFILFEPRQDRKGPRAVGVRHNPDSLVEVGRALFRMDEFHARIAAD